MTISKLPSGNFRIQYIVNGKRKSITVDHKPLKREAEMLVAEATKDVETYAEDNDSFKNFCKEYLEAKKNVLSPNTRRGYNVCKERLSEEFLATNINDITQLLIQREISQLSSKYAAKTVRNTYGFISAVLEMYRPQLVVKITLPQAEKKEMYCPTDEDIKRILELAKPTKYYVAFCLGVMGMRRGEICALELSDLDGNTLSINKATYIDENQLHGIKAPKTTDSTRKIYIPDELADRIRKDGAIYSGAESRLWAALSDMQEMLGIQHFRFHDLRVYFATYAHLMGLPDRVIQDTAGWRSDYTMKKIYRKTQEQKNEEGQKNFWSSMGF